MFIQITFEYNIGWMESNLWVGTDAHLVIEVVWYFGQVKGVLASNSVKNGWLWIDSKPSLKILFGG